MCFTHSEEISPEHNFYFTIPIYAVDEQEVVVKLLIDDPRAPADFGLSPDSRKLGVGLHGITIFLKY